MYLITDLQGSKGVKKARTDTTEKAKNTKEKKSSQAHSCKTGHLSMYCPIIWYKEIHPLHSLVYKYSPLHELRVRIVGSFSRRMVIAPTNKCIFWHFSWGYHSSLYGVRTGHGKPGKSWNFIISFSSPGKS